MATILLLATACSGEDEGPRAPPNDRLSGATFTRVVSNSGSTEEHRLSFKNGRGAKAVVATGGDTTGTITTCFLYEVADADTLRAVMSSFVTRISDGKREPKVEGGLIQGGGAGFIMSFRLERDGRSLLTESFLDPVETEYTRAADAPYESWSADCRFQ